MFLFGWSCLTLVNAASPSGWRLFFSKASCHRNVRNVVTRLRGSSNKHDLRTSDDTIYMVCFNEEI